MTTPNAHCGCGEASFHIDGPPLLRMFCHCTICQRFNEAPFGDVTIYRRADVRMPDEARVEYANYAPYPLVHRGRCVACGDPAVEYVALPLAPGLVVVPSANVHAPELVPEPDMHLFYETRVTDISDPLPKHEGFLRSQLSLTFGLLSALLRGR